MPIDMHAAASSVAAHEDVQATKAGASSGKRRPRPEAESPNPKVAKQSLIPLIDSLKQEQKEVREKRQAVTASLRNAMRRKRRLKIKARQLNDDDLLMVLKIAEEELEETTTCSSGKTGPEPVLATRRSDSVSEGEHETT
jgi:hypothetical protein